MRCVLRVAREYQDRPRVSCSLAMSVVLAKQDGVSSCHQFLGDGVCLSPRIWIVITFTLRGIRDGALIQKQSVVRPG